MVPQGANRFLDCVLHRGGNDTMLLVSVMLFAVLGIPGFIIYLLEPYIEMGLFTLDTVYTYMLFMTVLVAFFTRGMVAAVVRHHRRDVEWMGALLEYAEGQGKNTTAMRPLCMKMEGLVGPGLRRYMSAAFVALLVFNIYQALFWPIDWMTALELLIMLVIAINLSLASIYVLHRVQSIDSIQTRFTGAFCDSMLGEQPILEEMRTGVKERSLWPHVILVIATVGLYSMFFCLWSAHVMNVHIKKQWIYEEDMIKWMMAKDGLNSIRVAESPNKTTFFEMIYRIF